MTRLSCREWRIAGRAELDAGAVAREDDHVIKPGRGYCADFGDVGYTTSARPGWNQGLPCHGNVGLGPYSIGIYSQ